MKMRNLSIVLVLCVIVVILVLGCGENRNSVVENNKGILEETADPKQTPYGQVLRRISDEEYDKIVEMLLTFGEVSELELGRPLPPALLQEKVHATKGFADVINEVKWIIYETNERYAGGSPMFIARNENGAELWMYLEDNFMYITEYSDQDTILTFDCDLEEGQLEEELIGWALERIEE